MARLRIDISDEDGSIVVALNGDKPSGTGPPTPAQSVAMMAMNLALVAIDADEHVERLICDPVELMSVLSKAADDAYIRDAINLTSP